MTVLYNLAKVSTPTTGTGTITLGSAISGYLTFAQSGVQNGDVVAYGIRDGANSEVGTGTYSSSGPTLTRSVTKSTNSNNPISLSGTAEVYITARSEDIVNKTGDTMTGSLTLLNTGLKVQDTNASHTLSIVPGSDLTANRTLTWTTGDSDRNITLTGNTTIPAVFPTSTTDKGIPRFSGTAGSFQTSLLAVDDSGNITGANSIDIGNTDTTITRASSGVIAVEGSNVLMASNIGSTVQGYSANLNSLSSVFTAASAAGPASLKLYEDTDNGSQYVELIAPNSIVTSNKQASLQDVTGTLYITNGQDVAIADGGTGASDSATARSNLGLGSIATQNANNVSVTGGAISGTAINGFTGDTTAITIGTNQFVKDVSGNIGIGTSPSSILNIYNATDSTIINQGESTVSIVNQKSSTDANGPQFYLRKTRGSVASPTAVESGDGLGQYLFQAYGGTNYRNLASIQGRIDTYTSDTDISSVLIFNTSPSGAAVAQERMRLDSSGRLGIGTASPTVPLDVQGKARFYSGTSNVDTSVYVGNADELVGQGGIISFIASAATPYLQIGAVTQGVSFRSVVVCEGGGDFNINAPAFYPNPGIRFSRNGSSAFGNSNGGTGFAFLAFFRSGVNLGGISQNGTTGITYGTNSDYRLKENTQPMTNGLNIISQLKPVTYNWKSDQSAGEGFVAHELQQVIPNAVTGEKDAVNEDGSIKPQNVDYGRIVVHLVSALQELNAKVDTLTAEFDAYKTAHS